MAGRPKKFKSKKQLQELIDKYFNECKQEGLHPTMGGLALSLGCDRKTITNYEKDSTYFHTIKDARERVEEATVQTLMSGKATVGAIFNLKNNFGWKDKSEVENKHTISITRKSYDEIDYQDAEVIGEHDVKLIS